MQAFLINYLPTILSILAALGAAFQPQINSAVVAHPQATAVIGALWGVFAHMLPGSPLPGGGTLGITPPKQ